MVGEYRMPYCKHKRLCTQVFGWFSRDASLSVPTTHLSPIAMCSAAVCWLRVPFRLYATASVEPAGM